jgi:hypothetical protein
LLKLLVGYEPLSAEKLDVIFKAAGLGAGVDGWGLELVVAGVVDLEVGEGVDAVVLLIMLGVMAR